MTQTTKPSKQAVRRWLDNRARTHEQESPPPTPEEIRRELGWYLLGNNGPAPEVPE